MYNSRLRHKKRQRNRNRLFFLLFVIILVALPIAIAMNLGEKQPMLFIKLNTSAQVHPPISTYLKDDKVNIDLNLPASGEDTWQVKDNKLTFLLHNPDAAAAEFLEPGDSLGQHIEHFVEKGIFHIVIELINLPPVLRVKRTSIGYRIELAPAGLEGKRIALDPGHGGHDPGAVGHYLGLMEKDVTLAVALELEDMLLESGAEVFMTRTSDTLVNTSVQPGQHIRPDLWERRDIADDWSPDLFVSIHNNSWRDGSAYGIETYYNRYSLNSPNSRRAAEFIQDKLVEEIQRWNRGVKYKPNPDAVLQMDSPAVLCEILFISNRAEEAILADPAFAKRAAEAIYDGICEYFESPGGGSQ